MSGRRPDVYVELCAGLASVAWSAWGGLPPVSRQGSKVGVARRVREILGVPSRPRRVVLVERDPALCAVLRVLAGPPAGREAVACLIEGVADLPPAGCWRRACSGEFGPVASWLLRTAGARGGIGGWKGGDTRGTLRPRDLGDGGFMPHRRNLARRLREFPDVGGAVEVAEGCAASFPAVPGAVHYLDPPYAGTQGYAGGDLPVRPEEVCLRLLREGALRVGMSEARVPDLPGWTLVDLTGVREGVVGSRNNYAAEVREYLAVSPSRR